jgi:hypothetical protein
MRPPPFWTRRIVMFVLVTAIVVLIAVVLHRHVSRLAVRAAVLVIGLAAAWFFSTRTRR